MTELDWFQNVSVSHFNVQSSLRCIMNNSVPASLSSLSKIFSCSECQILKFLLNLLKDARSDNLTAKWQWTLSGLLPTHLSPSFAAEQVGIMKSNSQTWGPDNSLCSASPKKDNNTCLVLLSLKIFLAWSEAEICIEIFLQYCSFCYDVCPILMMGRGAGDVDI